jgi:hypothetical protein
MQTNNDLDTGSGLPVSSDPAKPVAKSGGPTAGKSFKASSPKRRADAAETDDPRNRVAVINATLTRIRDWFGDSLAMQIANVGLSGSQRVVIVLPEALTLCAKCRRIRLADEVDTSGLCGNCR